MSERVKRPSLPRSGARAATGHERGDPGSRADRAVVARYHPAPCPATRWRCACAPSRRAAAGAGPPWPPPSRSSGRPVLAYFHQQLDLSTYLLGGAHTRRRTTSSPSRIRPTTSGSPIRRSPRCCSRRSPTSRFAPVRWSFSWVNLGALFAMIVVSLRAVCRALDRRTVLWWAPRPRVAGAALRPGAPDLPARAGQHHSGADDRGRPDHGAADPRGDPGGAGRRHQGDADHPDPVPLPDPTGPVRHAGHRLLRGAPRPLAVAVNASTSWSYWTHYIRDPQRAGMLSWVGNQGVLGATERMLGHTVTTPTTFVIVVTVGGARACVIAAGAYRRSLAGARAPRGGGHRVAGQPGLVVPPLHLDGAAGGLAGPGRGPAPLWRVVGARRGRALVGGAYWWVPHGPDVRFAGRGWLIPVCDAYVLVFIVLLVGAARPGGPLVCRASRAPAGGRGAVGRRRLSEAQEHRGRRRARRRGRAAWAPGSSRRAGDDCRVRDTPAGDDQRASGGRRGGTRCAAPRPMARRSCDGGGAQGPRPARSPGATTGKRGDQDAARSGPGAQGRSRPTPRPRASGRRTGSRPRTARAAGVVTGRSARAGRRRSSRPQVETDRARGAGRDARARSSRWRLSARAWGRSTSNQRAAPPPKRRARPS